MRFYVATSTSSMARYKFICNALTNLGHTLTRNWSNDKAIISNCTATDDLKWIAEADLQAVAEAEVVIVLLPGGGGTHVELGFAVASEIPVILWCDKQDGDDIFGITARTLVFYYIDGVTRISCDIEELPQRLQRWLVNINTL